MDIIVDVRHFVEEECKKPTSKYGYEPFVYHFIPVVKHAQELVEKLGGDEEVVTLAAWLHDIGSIIHGRENHHLTGAKIAGEKLKELNYPEEKIALVVKCILNHRGSQGLKRESLEEKIVAEADVMSNFDNMPGLFKVALVYEGLDQGAAKDSVREKLVRKWNQLHFEDSKEIVRPRYEAVLILLK